MHYQVAIVGYGPAGATLANMLGRRGVSSVVLEQEYGIYDLPRAVHFDDEVMRIFQGIGIDEDLSNVVRFNPGMKFVDSMGTVMLDWPRPTEMGSQAWLSSYRFHQPDLELILRDHAAHYPDVVVQTGCEVLEIDDSDLPIRLVTKNRRTNMVADVTADWVVGCDGARSLVRRKIATKMDDLGFREHWLVVDILLTGEWNDLGTSTLQFCVPERPTTYVCGPDNRRRWEIALQPDDDLDAVSTDDAIWNFLSPWISRDAAVLERRALYEFHSINADQWRKGRLFIAGDAAHQMPPFMGQGMCSGMRDVANLAWKLSAVVKGKSPESLLDTYTSERAPHVREYIQAAIRLGGLINTSNTKQALETAFLGSDGTAVMKSIAPSLGRGLGPRGVDWMGKLGPQFILENGERTDGLVNDEAFLLIDPNALKHVPTNSIVTVPAETIAMKHYLSNLEVSAILVRPDYYVFDIARDGQDVERLVKDWIKTTTS